MRFLRAALALVLACSAKAPSGAPPSSPQPVTAASVPVPLAEPAEHVAPRTPSDPREARLAITVTHLLEPAKTEDDLRDRWRKRLELEVLERIAGMEKRLDKAKDAKDAKDKDKKAG